MGCADFPPGGLTAGGAGLDLRRRGHGAENFERCAVGAGILIEGHRVDLSSRHWKEFHSGCDRRDAGTGNGPRRPDDADGGFHGVDERAPVPASRTRGSAVSGVDQWKWWEANCIAPTKWNWRRNYFRRSVAVPEVKLQADYSRLPRGLSGNRRRHQKNYVVTASLVLPEKSVDTARRPPPGVDRRMGGGYNPQSTRHRPGELRTPPASGIGCRQSSPASRASSCPCAFPGNGPGSDKLKA